MAIFLEAIFPGGNLFSRVAVFSGGNHPGGNFLSTPQKKTLYGHIFEERINRKDVSCHVTVFWFTAVLFVVLQFA